MSSWLNYFPSKYARHWPSIREGESDGGRRLHFQTCLDSVIRRLFLWFLFIYSPLLFPWFLFTIVEPEKGEGQNGQPIEDNLRC